MAVTFDDLPGSPKAMTQILEVLETHGVPRVVGFVNGVRVERTPSLDVTLEAWLAQGHPLGNHTYTHPEMSEIGVELFIADIDRNDAFLRQLGVGLESTRYFRYPYLHQGFDAASTAAVREHLLEADYEVAEVTVDFYDWAFEPAYARCVGKGQEAAVESLERAYLDAADVALGWHQAALRQAYGRPIPHVLLLHGTDFTARMLDSLLTAYEGRGVEWISLEQALADPAYTDHEPPPKTYGDTLVEQEIRTRGVSHPPWFRHPVPLLEAVCP